MTALAIHQDKQTAMREFATRWTEAQSAVAAFIWSLVPNSHDADDLLQRTAQTLVDKLDQYDETQTFTAWAIGIAKIEVLRFRQERRRDRLVFDEPTIDAIEAATTRNEVDLRELQAVLKNCADKLTTRLQQLLQLHYVEEASPREIAGRLGITENAVFVSLHRARVAMRRCVENQWRESGGVHE